MYFFSLSKTPPMQKINVFLESIQNPSIPARLQITLWLQGKTNALSQKFKKLPLIYLSGLSSLQSYLDSDPHNLSTQCLQTTIYKNLCDTHLSINLNTNESQKDFFPSFLTPQPRVRIRILTYFPFMYNQPDIYHKLSHNKSSSNCKDLNP